MQDPGVDLRSLFWRTTPVTLRRGDRDATVTELNVRVLAGYAPGTDALKVRARTSGSSTTLSALLPLLISESFIIFHT